MSPTGKCTFIARIRQLGGCLPVGEYMRWSVDDLENETARLAYTLLLAEHRSRPTAEAPTAAVTHPARQADTDPGPDVPPASDPGRPEVRTTTGKV